MFEANRSSSNEMPLLKSDHRLPRSIKREDEAKLRAVDAQHKRPTLSEYDIIIVSTSAGKDSSCCLDVVCEQARKEGVIDRVVAVHSDLGRIEWPGCPELAEEQAKQQGVRFLKVSRIGAVCDSDPTNVDKVAAYERGEIYGDIIDYLLRKVIQDQERARLSERPHTPCWPTQDQRWCTSEFKRGPIQRSYKMLADEWRKRTGTKSKPLILEAQGLRAEESPQRAKELQLHPHKEKKNVHVWLPLKWWWADEVCKRIRDRRIPSHDAYRLGMPRLSCVFCVLARNKGGGPLLIGGYHNRELLDEYCEAEAITEKHCKEGPDPTNKDGSPKKRFDGHFQAENRLQDIRARILRGEKPPATITAWEG